MNKPQTNNLLRPTHLGPADLTIAEPRHEAVSMRLEVVVLPVSDVDRAKSFYGDLGWRLDIDVARGEDFRLIQFTPPGSDCSIIFGRNVTTAQPGSVQGLHLVVHDLDAARAALLGNGI